MDIKELEDILKFMENHLLFGDLDDEERIDYFFKYQLINKEILKYDENNNLVNKEELDRDNILKEMAKFLAEDIKLLFKNIANIKILLSNEPDDSEKIKLVKNKINKSEEKIKNIIIDDLIINSYNRIILE